MKLVLSNECGPTQIFSKLKSDVMEISILGLSIQIHLAQPASTIFCQTQQTHTQVYLAQKIQA